MGPNIGCIYDSCVYDFGILFAKKQTSVRHDALLGREIKRIEMPPDLSRERANQQLGKGFLNDEFTQ